MLPNHPEDEGFTFGRGSDLLVVDDDSSTLVAYEAALAPLGRKIDLVQSGTEALARLLDHDYALVLLDMAMPELNGLETARLIRQRPRCKGLPIIFISAKVWPVQVMLEAYELGAFDFILKPILPEVLRAKVRLHLQLQDRARQLLEHAHHQTARLGHELRNPLAAMTSALELMKLRDHTLTRELAIIDRQVAHVTRVLGDLLGLSTTVQTSFSLHADDEVLPPQTEHPLRILLVDDNLDGGQLLGELLRSIGHDVVVTHDAPSALKAAEQHAPDVALLDIALPEIDGYEVARRLRQLPGCEGTVLVAVTAFGQAEDRDRSQRAGFAHHLVKPVDISLLATLLKK